MALGALGKSTASTAPPTRSQGREPDSPDAPLSGHRQKYHFNMVVAAPDIHGFVLPPRRTRREYARQRVHLVQVLTQAAKMAACAGKRLVLLSSRALMRVARHRGGCDKEHGVPATPALYRLAHQLISK